MKQLIGSNLNNRGNSGTFEQDVTTWGLPLNGNPDIVLQRSSPTEGYLGLYCCHITTNATVANLANFLQAAADLSPKKVYFSCWIKDVGGLSIDSTLANKFRVIANDGAATYTPVQETAVTMADISNWVKYEAYFDLPGSANPSISFELGLFKPDNTNSTTANGNAVLRVDEVKLFEWVEIVDPCTLTINTSSTVVTNESTPGANNGSIQVAVNGGTSPFQYSKDGGTTWQSSNLFTGLAPGIYNMVVREQARISCNSAQSFAVNAASVSFSFTTDVTNETVLGAADGIVNVTVSGTGGPFTFSRNAGATFQSANVFTSLAPGTYTIVVKNASGAILSANVTVQPGLILYDKIYWSKNPIPYLTLAPANWASLVNLRMYCEVQVEDVAGSGVFNSKMKMSLYPASNGECLFNLRQALRSVFSLTPPAINSNTIVKLTDRAKAFKVITDTMEGDVVTPTGPFTTSKTMLVLYGGLSTYAHALSNFFTDLATTKKFLTWQPDNKLLDAFQEDYLNFLVYDVAITSINLEAKAYYDDGTNQTAVLKTQAGVKYGELYQLPVGTANSGVKTINAAKNLVKYEVRVLNQSAAAISEVRTFLVAPVTHPLTRFIMLINSLGAHEVHRMTGEAKKTKDVSKEMIEKYLPPVYDALQGQFENTEGSFVSKVNYSTGLFTQSNAAEWQEYLVDLLMSKIAYETVGTNRYPLVIETSSIVADEDRVYEKFVRFDAINSYIDKAYTPQ